LKAAVLHGAGDVRVEEVELPSLKSGEVRVQIEAALTCGTDLKVFKRGYHAKMIRPPAVFGHEFAGVITEVGEGVVDWRAGDRVVAANSAPCGECSLCLHEQESLCDDLLFLNGAYAEAINIPARIVEKNLLRLKPETGFADAALTEPLACVVQGVAESRLWPGDRLLVIGAGPIGLMFVALAQHLGCHITMAGRNPARLAAAKKLGAHHVVEIADGTELVKAVKASPSIGHGFDVVVEATGRPEVWEASVELVRKGGLVNFFGGCPSGTSVTLDTGLLHYSSITLKASFHHTPHSVAKALEFIERGVVRAGDFVGAEARLDDLPGVFASMVEDNRVVKTLIRA
jgi:L-iditol 2-dehydrogenase